MRLTLSAFALGAVLAAPAMAFSFEEMTGPEREALRQEVRSYLLENPEVLIEAMQVLEEREAESRAEADRSLVSVNAAALFENPDDWVGGNPDGDVTMVEFFDYRCGYCKRAHPEVAALLESDGNVRLIRKELPVLGDQSILGARFAIAVRSIAGDEAYGDVSDALMAMRSDITPERLAQMATTFGLDADAVMAEIDSDATTEVIRDNQLLAMRLQIQGTPAFVIGDTLLRGYVPQDQMQAVVDDVRE